MTDGLLGQHAGQVLAHHQSGHRRVPPEVPVGHRDHTHVVAATTRHQRIQHRGTQLTAEDPHCRTGSGPEAHRGSTRGRRHLRCRAPAAAIGPRCPVALRRCSVDPVEEPGLHPDALLDGSVELHLERAGHADAVLVHPEALVDLRGREVPSGEQVVLVRRVHHRVTQRSPEHLLGRLDRVDDSHRLGARVGPHLLLGAEATHPEGHHRNVGQLGELIEDPGEGPFQHLAVVAAGADHDLAVHLHSVVEQGAQPAQAHRSAPVAQHVGAQVRIGAVDRHVQRGEALGHHPFEVGLGEPGERGEVPVQERQPVVVVLEVQTPAHPRRKLVDETELAVVVTGAHLVEHRRVDLDPERLPEGLGHLEAELEAASTHLEIHIGFIGQPAVLDDVANGSARHREEFVTRAQPCHVGR